MNFKTEGEYVGCRIGKAQIAIPVDLVQEVFETGVLTRLPGSPPFVRGLINFRGVVVPVLDPWQLTLDEAVSKKVVILKTSQDYVGLLISQLLDLVRFTGAEAPREYPPELSDFSTYFPLFGRQGDLFYLMDVEPFLEYTLQLKEWSA